MSSSSIMLSRRLLLAGEVQLSGTLSVIMNRRDYATHWNPKFKKLRAAKIIKVFIYLNSNRTSYYEFFWKQKFKHTFMGLGGKWTKTRFVRFPFPIIFDKTDKKSGLTNLIYGIKIRNLG
jgi:hypothetical protein